MNPSSQNHQDGGTLRTRATLLFRLRDWRDDETWKEFYDLYYNFIYRHARGSNLNHHDAEEVTHLVFQACAKSIETYEQQPRPGSFRRWLGNQARWRIIDKQRERKKPSNTQSNFSTAEQYNLFLERLPAPPDPEIRRLEEEWQLELYETALKRLAKKAKPKHYQVFHLHNRDAWPLKKIASELGMSQTYACVINHRLKKQLKQDLQKLADRLD